MTSWILWAALSAAAPARAEKARQLSDAAIEQRKTELDDIYHRVADETEREFQENVAFHARMKEERLDFERGLIADRKRFLDSLKSTPPAQRKAAYEGFHDAETLKRREFDRHAQEEKQAYKREFLEEKRDAGRDIQRRRQALSAQRHQRP